MELVKRHAHAHASRFLFFFSPGDLVWASFEPQNEIYIHTYRGFIKDPIEVGVVSKGLLNDLNSPRDIRLGQRNNFNRHPVIHNLDVQFRA